MRNIIVFVLSAMIFSWSGGLSFGQISQKQLKNRQRQIEAVQRRQVAEKRRAENNVRSLCMLLNDKELREKLKITPKQEVRLDELDRKYDEIRDKTINPTNKKLAPKERRANVKNNRDELMDLSLKAGKAVLDILTDKQAEAYARYVTYERAKHAWEKRMGIEPEKPAPKK